MQTPKIPLLDYESARFFAALPKEKKKAFIAGLTDAEAMQLRYLWEAWARGTQLSPPGRWVTWLNMGGRGAGKTRAGSEWIRKKKETTPFLHLIGRTAADVRDVMVDGESGILAISPPWDRPTYQRSKRRLVWNNGAQAITFSADEPESLRGPQCGGMWLDECLIAGTLIATDKGDVPIEQIQPGDIVWTRTGLKRVKHAWCSNTSATVYDVTISDGRVLTGTANHPIWIQGKGFKPLYSLSYGDILMAWEQLKLRKALFGMDADGGSTEDIIATEEESCCTEPFMHPCMVQFLKEWTYTIKTRIKQIMTSRILRCLPVRSTLNAIDLEDGLYGTKRRDKRLHGSNGLIENLIWQCVLIVGKSFLQQVPLLNSVTLIAEQHIDVRTIHRFLKELVNTVGSRFLSIKSEIAIAPVNVAMQQNGVQKNHVWRVVKSSGQKLRTLSVVPVNAESFTKIETISQKREYASIVAKHSQLISLHQKQCFVQEHAETCIETEKNNISVIKVEQRLERMAVFNMEVEDCHEYFANGVLVHNCGAWQYEDAFDQAMFGLRLGSDPQACATTTPRVTRLIKKLLSLKTTAITRSSTYDNKDNLAEAFFTSVIARYENSRLGRQELEGELLEDFEGALWNRDLIENNRVVKAPELIRVVVGVDPAVTNNEDSDETGIIVAGKGVDGDAYVLADYTLKGSPLEWAQAVVSAYHLFSADRVVGETNNGGDLIEQNIRLVDPDVSYKSVHASRGKQTRAEPIVSLYEQGRAHHVGLLAKLEDEQCTWEQGKKSPNRLDACVWALTELGFNNGYIPVVVSSSTAPTVPQRYTSDDEEENARLAQQQERVASIMNRLRKLGGVPL